MSIRVVKKQDLERHIEKLEKRLGGIYTLTPPHQYFEGRNVQEVNILDQLERYDFYESIYSAVDKNEIRISETSKEYLGYLKNLREGKRILEIEKMRIDEENSAEIENILILLKEFKLKMESME